MNWVIVLFLLFTFIGLSLSVLFVVKKRGDRLANVILGVYTALFSFELLNNCLRWSGDLYTETFVHLNLAHFPLWTIYGALVFIYVRRVIKNSGFKFYDLLFLVPPTIMMAMIYPFYRLSTSDKLQVLAEGRTYDYAYFPRYTIWIVIGIMFFYALLTYFTFSWNKRIGWRENKWLKWFVGSYFGFVFLFALYIFLVRFQIMDPSYDYLIDIGIVLFIGLLAFFGLVQPGVFEGKALKEILPFIKYQKTGLSKALSLEMKEKLLVIMQRERPYLNNELRLDDLSHLMNLSRNHTSQIINEHFNLSFFDFINRYRITEAKNLLMNMDTNGLTVTQIAYDVGFNNRASFYKAFKKFANLSPSQYVTHMKAS